MITIKRINAIDTRELRCRVLQLHQTQDECQYAGDFDEESAHFGAFENENIVGILSCYPQKNALINQSSAWQLRAVAVSEHIQGQGIGKLLLNVVERHTIDAGGQCLWANARKSAIGFYKKAGYQVMGDEFHRSNIGPQQLVFKNL